MIFEECRGQWPNGFLLSLTDRYDCRIQFKGGSCQFRATGIWFTTPTHPQDWHSDLMDGDEYTQLERRLSRVIHLDELVEAERAKRVCLMMDPPSRAQSEMGGVLPVRGESGEAFSATVPYNGQLVSDPTSQPVHEVGERPVTSLKPPLTSPSTRARKTVVDPTARNCSIWVPDGFCVRASLGDGNC